MSGLIQQGRNGDFDMPLNVAHDRRHAKVRDVEPEDRGGYFWTGLTDALRASLVSAARHEAENARVDGRIALKEHGAAKLARREERVIELLNAAVDQYAYALELFEQWKTQGAKDRKVRVLGVMQQCVVCSPQRHTYLVPLIHLY